MSKKRFKTDESTEKCAHSEDNDSDSNDNAFPVRKRSKQIVIEDDTTDEDDINDEDDISDDDTIDKDDINCEDNTADDDHINPQRSSEQWIWKEENNKPKIWKYTQTPGITLATLNQLGESKRELDVFHIIFDSVFWKNIVMGTNRCAEQTIGNVNIKQKRDETWVPVDCNEIKVYFALCIIMTQFKKKTIQMNWSEKALIETPIFAKTMPLTRFLQINKFFHFANNNADDNSDRLFKIKPVSNFFNVKFKKVYIMEEDIVVDESLITFMQQFPSKIDIKFYKLCESASGYCYNFKIYLGKNKMHPDDNATESVVMELSRSILHKGHTLYLSNWYSSPKLFLTLINNQTNAIGAVHSNRRILPRNFFKAQLIKGECRIRSCNGILALKWKDRRDIYIISTKHETVEMIEPDENQFNPALKPKCLVEYNRGRIGVDRQDQMSACFPIMRKYMKEYQKVFFYIFDMALFNSYILYKKINTEKKQTYSEYIIEIAESLIKNAPLLNHTVQQGPSSNDDAPLRLHAQQWGHFPKRIDPTPSKQKPSRACKVCTKHKKRSESKWECKECQVTLHLPHCFERYHTIEDY